METPLDLPVHPGVVENKIGGPQIDDNSETMRWDGCTTYYVVLRPYDTLRNTLC